MGRDGKRRVDDGLMTAQVMAGILAQSLRALVTRVMATPHIQALQDLFF